MEGMEYRIRFREPNQISISRGLADRMELVSGAFGMAMWPFMKHPNGAVIIIERVKPQAAHMVPVLDALADDEWYSFREGEGGTACAWLVDAVLRQLGLNGEVVLPVVIGPGDYTWAVELGGKKVQENQQCPCIIPCD